MKPNHIENNRARQLEYYKHNQSKRKGAKMPLDVVERVRLKKIGKKHSEDHKRKISEANKGKPHRRTPVIDIKTGIKYKSVTEAYINIGIAGRTAWRWLKNDNSRLKYA